MKPISPWGWAALACAAALQAAAQVPAVSRWHDPSGRPRPSHAPDRAAGPLRMVPAEKEPGKALLRGDGSAGRICVVVHSNVYDALGAGLSQYQADLENEDYVPLVYRYDSGSATNLRNYLAGLYAEAASLAGAVLVGEIPYIIYEMNQDWGEGGGVEYEDFPCDFFYMDLNGRWSDFTNAPPFSAGKYDSWSGDTNLEIWVSRLKAANLSPLGTETFLLNNYFAKDHAYRDRTLVPDRRALVYVDDPWWNMVTYDADYLSRVYGDLHARTVFDEETTSARDYMTNHMTANYELMFVRAHGSHSAHAFYTNSRANIDDVYSRDYRRLTPPALFYSFFVCSGADYSLSNSLATTTALNTNRSGLVSWGSTKTGGMWAEGEFYDRLADGKSIGESFREWFNIEYPRYQAYNVAAWWGGLVIAGDASLPVAHADPPSAGLAASGAGRVTDWKTIRYDPYTLQRCTNLGSYTWIDAGTITAAAYAVSFTDTTAAAGLVAYRLRREAAPPPSNLLFNGSFEMPGALDSDARYWRNMTPDLHGDTWGNAARREGWQARRGYWEATVQGTWGGWGADGGWWQETAGSPGETFEASAWFWADHGGAYGTWTAALQQLKIEFYSSSYGSPISTNVADLSDVAEAWTRKTVTGVAPAGTAWARLVVSVLGAGAEGSLQFDDAELKRLP